VYNNFEYVAVENNLPVLQRFTPGDKMSRALKS
jgi:hypothetical protein